MQAYGQDFARIYNVKWSDFAKQIAPFILDFYTSTSIGRTNRSVLDLSEYMLHHARENASQFLESGQGKFIKADVNDFS